jgi:putative transposase
LPDYNYHIEFLTATILRWQHLLADNTHKQIILDSLGWLVKEERCKVFGFVIMPNRIHLIWRINNKHARAKVQGALKFYSPQIQRTPAPNRQRKIERVLCG